MAREPVRGRAIGRFPVGLVAEIEHLHLDRVVGRIAASGVADGEAVVAALREAELHAHDEVGEGGLGLVLVEQLGARTERMHELRQVSPFAGVLSPQERWRIHKEAGTAE